VFAGVRYAPEESCLSNLSCFRNQEVRMSEKFCKVGDCIWAGTDSFCKTLADAAVPLDGKWPLLILYLRGIRDIESLTEVQKTQMHELLRSILNAKDFSQTHFREAQMSILSIITRSYQERLNQFARETAELAKDMRSLFGKHQREVSVIVKNTDAGLARGSDPVHLLSEIRDVLKGVVAKMEEDANTLVNLSQKDSLTGLANRRSFDSFLNECVERWQKNRKKSQSDHVRY